MLIQCAIGHEMEVLRDLLNLDSVKEAKGTFGYYDILVKIVARDYLFNKYLVIVSLSYFIPCLSTRCFTN